MARRKEPRIPDALLDQLLASADPKTAFDPNGLLEGVSGISCVGGHDGEEGDLPWPDAKRPAIPDALLDQLLAGADPKTAFDPNGLLDDLKKALAERVLNAEMDHHLATGEAANSPERLRVGSRVVTDTGKIDLDIPRDRQARPSIRS
ncbi:transposase [Methylosinus sp. LW4]|uniref:transposase n=1 Tax=Methylosinus sp. LW4 TaxID=136993 RepID=UPI0003A801A6